MSEWIKFSDKFPEILDYVLVCAIYKGTDEPKPISIARIYPDFSWDFLGNIDVGAWMDIEYDMDGIDVTHWMPIPKSPKE